MSDSNNRVSKSQSTILLLIVNIIVGVGIPFLVSRFSATPLSLGEGTLLAFLILMTLTLIEVLFIVKLTYDLKVGELEIWDHRQGVDGVIGKIRTGLHHVIADENLRDSFFLDHYRRELELLLSRIQHTISKREVLLDRHHIDSTEVLLSLYDSSDHEEFLATHVVGDITDYFDVTYQVYFDAWLKRLKEGKVKSLRRLFVYEDEKEFERLNARKLAAFHNSKVPGLEAKAIKRSELMRFKNDYFITDGVEDFGIFSNAYIYLGQRRQNDDISGYFSRDQVLIRNYTNCFNALWSATSTVPIKTLVSDSISPQQLFDQSYKFPDLIEGPPRDT